jgi:hypothetical protein
MADTPLAHIKVQELLKEVQVDYTRTKLIEAAIASVTESLLSAHDKQVGYKQMKFPAVLFNFGQCNAAVHFILLLSMLFDVISRVLLVHYIGFYGSGFRVCERSEGFRRERPA